MLAYSKYLIVICGVIEFADWQNGFGLLYTLISIVYSRLPFHNLQSHLKNSIGRCRKLDCSSQLQEAKIKQGVS